MPMGRIVVIQRCPPWLWKSKPLLRGVQKGPRILDVACPGGRLRGQSPITILSGHHVRELEWRIRRVWETPVVDSNGKMIDP